MRPWHWHCVVIIIWRSCGFLAAKMNSQIYIFVTKSNDTTINKLILNYVNNIASYYKEQYIWTNSKTTIIKIILWHVDNKCLCYDRSISICSKIRIITVLWIFSMQHTSRQYSILTYRPLLGKTSFIFCIKHRWDGLRQLSSCPDGIVSF